MEVNNITIDIYMKNEKECSEVIKQHWERIPLVNVNDVQNLRDHSLVRFRGMVQDMYNPEYYFEKFEVINETTSDTELRNGMYMDTAECKSNEVVNMESGQNVTGERNTYVLITFPGYNKWAKDIEMKKNVIVTRKDNATSPTKASSTSPLKSFKRTLEPTEMETETVQQLPTSSKKQCTSPELSSKNKAVVSQEYILNFPIPDPSGKACLMKIYSNFDTIKLNDMIECVGFLSVNPLLDQTGYEPDEDNGDSQMEMQTHNPPPSLVPRIHCVTYKKLENYNPLCDSKFSATLETLLFLRKELHIVLTNLAFGDELVGEYLLYHLISRVYLRKDLMALGKFSLNVSNISVENYGETFYKFLELMLLKSHYLPMTIGNLNDLTFIPKKDYECNRITSGILQLSENTHLVIDETKMSEGKLNTEGVRAIQALANVIKHQRLNYDFNFYRMEYDCDIPCLVLSEGKSMLPSDFHIKLQPEAIQISTFQETATAMSIYLKPELLDAIRAYLLHRRFAEYEISDNINELVQQEFLNMRQNVNATGDDLHQLLVLARLVCLAEGKGVLDEVCWKRACQLEADRKARFTT